jgi:uncharacterized membrane protein
MTNGQNSLPSTASDADLRVRRVELTISNLLRIGVVASLTLVLLGTVVTFVQHPSYVSQPGELQRLITPGIKFPHALRDLGTALRQLQGEAIVVLGLLVLIATPVMRVAISILAFIYQGDRIFTLITSLVLCLLMLSLVLGRVG